MILREYKDLGEAYIKLNQEFLTHPQNVVKHMENTRAICEDLVINVKKPDASSIDLGAVGYKGGKWGHLLRTYLDVRKFNQFRELCNTTRGVSIAFDFKRKKTGNGSCMREIILTRKSRNKPWTGATFIWRATELQKRWAADLILVHRLLEAIPNSDFKDVKLQIVSAYQSGMYVVPLVEPLFGVDWETIDPDKHPYWKLLLYRKEKYYQEDSPPQKLSPAIIMQEVERCHREGIELPSVTIDDCIIGGLR